MDKISIIIPVYNTSQYLSQCIDSILKQTYPNIEIILINDESTDESLEICQKYAEMNQQISLINKINTGVSDTRNIGIKNSTGKYIWFIDSDDWIEENSVEIIMNNINDKDILIFGMNKEYKNKTIKVKPKKEEINSVECEKKIIEDNEIGGYVGNKVFNKKIINEYNLKFNKKITMCEDLEFCMNFVERAKKIKVIDNSLYNYRMRKSSMSNKENNQKKIEDMLFVYKRAYDFLLKNNLDLSTIRYKICNMYYSTNDKNVKKKIKKMFNYRYFEEFIKTLCSIKISTKQKIILTSNFINSNLTQSLLKKRCDNLFFD